MTEKKFSKKEREEIYQDAYEKIESGLPYVDCKPYSSNIISCRLRLVAHKCGNKMANKLIDDLDLISYGWKKVV